MQGISLTLSGEQVSAVLREVTGSSGTRGFLLEQIDDLRIAVDVALANAALDTQHVSFSGLRMLSILCAFAPPGIALGLIEVAQERGLSPSTTHRYVQTLMEVGLLEQVPRSRKYRIPPAEKTLIPED